MTTLFTLYYYKEIQLVLFLFKTLNAVFLFLFLWLCCAEDS